MKKEKSVSVKFLKEFNSNTKNKLIEYEIIRQKFLLYFVLSIILVLLILYGAYYFVASNITASMNDLTKVIMIIFIFFIGVPGSFLINILIIKKYKTTIKKKVFPKLLSFLGDFEMLDANRGKTIFFPALELFDNYNRYKLDDRIKGVYKNLDVDIMEIKLTYEESTRNSKHIQTIFQGILIRINCIRDIKNSIIIKRNLADLLNNKNRVILEDPEFEKLFDVYSNDQVEARYILTTSFMQRLKDLSNRKFAKNLSMSFEKGYINIAIPSAKDWFEVPLFKNALDLKIYREILRDIENLLSIVDILKLDKNIGL